jgi:hypothetical protein
VRLPKWFPEVPKPWNPAYRGVWHVMTREERQWSLFIDLLVVLVAIIIWAVASGNVSR